MWGANGVQSQGICRENLEETAARLKKQIDIKSALHQPLVRYVDNFSHALDRDETKTLYAIVGGLSMEIPKLESEYQALLAKIEAGEK